MYLNEVRPFIRGKVCMVTGGGGSIGSEIARCLARIEAEKIVLVDIYENGVYDVKCDVGDIAVVEIVSVCDYDKMNYLMSQYRPNIIFHTAAHKHVPFMENNPEEAVKNNIIGTEIMAGLADKYKTDNFMFISTDKAVEPASVLGASKRCSEMFLYDRSQMSTHTKFTSVRFGNVINSSGSVIPLFKKQIETGVVTVTDKDVTRFFMSIAEAVELVLLSLTIAQGGEIFVLNMGDGVKILDIAEMLIRNAGKEPYKDVKIEFTGLRKGDKLQEKLLYDFEKAELTKYDKLIRIKGSSINGLVAALSILYKKAKENDRDGIKDLIMKITNEKGCSNGTSENKRQL